MELRQLKYFSAVADQLSFTNAATRLFVSQSAISQQISALESELGVQLLVRDKHTVALTQAGAEFYRNLQRILPQLDEAALSAQTTDRTRHYVARLTIGVQVNVFLDSLLSELVRAIQKTQAQFPFLIVDVRSVPFDQVEQVLLDGRADLVVSLEPLGDKSPFSKRICVRSIVQEPLVFGVQKQRLAADFGDALPDMPTLLAQYPLNLVSGNAAIIEKAFKIYRVFGLLPQVKYYNEEVEMRLRAWLGDGMCLMSASQAADPCNAEFLHGFPVEQSEAVAIRTILWCGGTESEPLRYLLDLLA
jgi:DNA-binding transcriptional LysR family regulator